MITLEVARRAEVGLRAWLKKLEPMFLPDLRPLAEGARDDCKLLGIRDGFLDCFVWVRHRRESGTWFIEAAALAAGSVTDPGDRSTRVSRHLLQHRAAADACLARALCRSGIPARVAAAGLELGNGRLLETGGFWFVYHTHEYRCGPASAQTELQEREVLLGCRVLLLASAFAAWVGENFPGEHEFTVAEPWRRSTVFEPDERALRFREERSSSLRRSLMETAGEAREHAERLVAVLPAPEDRRGKPH